MILLNEEQKKAIINKLKFTLNFMICANENIEEIFEINVQDAVKGEVKVFSLSYKDDISIWFKDYNDSFEVNYILESEDDKFMPEGHITFLVYREDAEMGDNGCNVDMDFIRTVDKIRDRVTELERNKQYEKFNSSINNLLHY